MWARKAYGKVGRVRARREILSKVCRLYMAKLSRLPNMSTQILDTFRASLPLVRWCAKHCDIQPGTIKLTKKVETGTGGKVVRAEEHAVLWPWDILHHFWISGKLLDWIYDPEDMATAKVHAFGPINLQCVILGVLRLGCEGYWG